ncbi:thiosulfate sulfurtransferase [Penicillium cinerascens]|uniref:Thiosulfate sulfurtransferase n=1 Tax=Penicillium cinerascens TaxID=70096 RepID=A0A9W9TAH1_9EURO|nr:thiosulfate sulfurtransferase [Penicillium cinerascens]KAJ5215582.1 thiosulfate sulfurtransferase [Penicillium cinerascens]
MKLPSPFPSLFVSPSDLHRALSNPPRNVRIIPVAAGNTLSLPSYESRHVPGSVFFNMDLIRDTTSQYPMMLPTSSQFAKYMTELEIRSDDILVVYDTFETGLHSSPRVAWMCHHFGHKAAHVLNNFSRYVQEGFSVSVGKLSIPPSFGPRVDYPEQQSLGSGVITFEELHDIINIHDLKGEYQIIDARPSDRFSGRNDGPSASLPSGHMPSAINVPFSSILGLDKTILPPADLQAVFTKAGVRENIPTFLSCNSGVTAAALDLALRTSGLQVKPRLYDGSWSEWAKRAVDQGMIVTE